MSSKDGINPDSPTGTNSKDAMFEPKPKPKMIRVLTVLAYVLSVSMAAILLSIYYIFIWEGRPHLGARTDHNYSEDQGYVSSTYASYEDYSSMPTSEIPKNVTEVLPSEIIRIVNGIRDDYRQEFNTTELNDTTDQNMHRNKRESETSASYLKINVALKLIGKAFQLLTRKMSYKSTNGIKLTKCDSQQWKTNSIHETSVKLAGEEAKDRLYEPKHKKKLVRVLTVVAYVFFVSLAAIMLSLYYVFLWNGDQKITTKYVNSQPKQQRLYLSNKCNSILAELQQQITAIESEEAPSSSTVPPTSEQTSVTWPDDFDEFEKPGIFFRKIIGGYDY